MSGFFRAVVTGALALATFVPFACVAQPTHVTLAGLAFAGDAASLDQRFPYSRRYESALAKSGQNAYAMVKAAVAQAPSEGLQVTTEQIDELKGRDQALVTSLVVSSETVSVESFGNLRKLFVLIRGQALFFDFKSMTVVRSYPLSFAYIDVFDRDPTDEEVLARVRNVYEGAVGKPGIFARYAAVLAKASVPAQVPRFVKVTKVSLTPEMLAALPAYLKGTPGVAETWAADMVGEAISTRVGVPIVPYTQGYAIGGVMPLRVSDGTVFSLTLPKPDYEISVDFPAFKKVKFGEAAAGTSYVYGSFANVKIEEPLSGTVYMNAPVKNGEVKVVPVTQTYVDDFPAYYDSLNGMFHKLSDAVAGKGNTWVKSASAAPDIEAQILKTRQLLDQCK
ncbi:hypothetical protein [Variovorax sp. Sphag1AA]|uniref:hypothetical protein n=1 Tax=Variovorax sp. Sphag1AA TaxID=2587027 RepID=UPI001839AB7B|nr:hypothetical protein [Variovorax sp. Sphag1AA]MBB3180996.1 hypothetical protein [Variovorax sp. Sphag1AA]